MLGLQDSGALNLFYKQGFMDPIKQYAICNMQYAISNMHCNKNQLDKYIFIDENQ